MRFSNWVKDWLIAPEMSEFTQAEIRDMTEVSARLEYALGNYLLNLIFRGDPGPPVRQKLYNFLRRSAAASEEYQRARDLTLRYLAAPDDRLLAYVKAITHWESYLGHAWQAFVVLNERGWFAKGDGSSFERLNHLHGRSKHTEKAIATTGQMPGESPLAVWMTNEGLTSTEQQLTYNELANLLQELATVAELIEDPSQAANKIAAHKQDSRARIQTDQQRRP